VFKLLRYPAYVLAVVLAALLAQAEPARGAQPTGMGYAVGYGSFFFSPLEDTLEVERPDLGSVAAMFTARTSPAHYLRFVATGTTEDSGIFALLWGWDLGENVAAFLGPTVRYLDDGAVPGYSGDTFTAGLGGSVDYAVKLADDREAEVVRFLFGVEVTTRRIYHEASAQRTRALAVTLGADLASTLFGTTNSTER